LPQQSPYKSERAQDHGVEIVRLTDAANNVEIKIAPSVGNRAYEMNVKVLQTADELLGMSNNLRK